MKRLSNDRQAVKCSPEPGTPALAVRRVKGKFDDNLVPMIRLFRDRATAEVVDTTNANVLTG